ncbi:MAG: LysR family transcriptional regulator [Hahellaceae bacterium]|nr:LysR family transcriptional regulator [Hahellaceae bacterium]MCP5170133.1 LysR family transcriptional regulator [Hahellaceae bacterium]
MDWQYLPDFLGIVRTRSLAGAARLRGVNHSTLFRRLNQLEKQLGARLFERLPDGYQLTLLGERLLPFAERMEEQAHALERELSGADSSLRGTVRLTAPDNIAYSYLPGYLKTLRERYPDICVELLVSNTDFNLNRHEADLALRATRQPPEYLVGRQIFQLGWGLYAAPEFVVSPGAPATLEQLPQWPVIGPDASLLYLPAFRWMQQQLPADCFVVRASNLMAMSSLAEAGLGVAALPDDQVKPGLKRLCDFEPGLRGGLWLLTHPDLRQTGRIKVVMDFLLEAFRQDERFAGLTD